MRSARLAGFTLLTALAAGCGSPTAPLTPFGTWQLEQLDGSPLPLTVTDGVSALQLIADTLELRAPPRGDAMVGTLVFVTRNPSGAIARSQVSVGYALDAGRITINFHCLYNQVCLKVYAPLTAVIGDTRLLFQESVGRESRLYRLVE